MVELLAIDGPPGTGKTRRIVEEARDWPVLSAVVTYTNDAANVLRKRAPDVQSGTVYSLTWPYVKPFMTGAKFLGKRSNQVYTKRKINHLFDPALFQYLDDAPSRRAKTRQDYLAQKLHAWPGPMQGQDDPPFEIGAEQAKGALKFLLPLAKWVAAGCPMPEDEKLEFLAIDEAQDMSWVELRAALGMLRDDGVAYAYGDPGQSIFGAAKGVYGSTLPPLWQLADADKTKVLDKGWRVGDPTASVAARVLSSYYERPADTFRADHRTELLTWDVKEVRPMRGLALGYSRTNVHNAFQRWGLTNAGVVPNTGLADTELVLSTGHAAKGAEADDVYLLPWSRVAMDRLEQRDPETLRLLYVMLTRARRRVFVPRALRARLPL
jgi:hypothetical protein